MAAYSGKSGSVTVGGAAVADVTKWSAEHKGEVTAFGSSSSGGWKTRVDGTEEVTGDIEGKVQSGAGAPIARGTIVALVLLTGGGQTLSGNAMIESISYEVDIDTGAPVSFKATFGSSGSWTTPT